VVGALAAALLAGCVSDAGCSLGIGVEHASASCAAGVSYQDHFYVAWSDELPVAKGELLGAAEYPGCNDGSGCGGVDEEGRPTRVWAMRGVDPEQVVVGRAEGTDQLVVFGRLHADPKDYFRFVGGTWHIRRAPATSTATGAPAR